MYCRVRTIRIDETVITPAVVPPVTVEYARRHIRSLGNSEDRLVQTWILSAAQLLEEKTGVQLITTTREIWMNEFPTIGRHGGCTGAALRIELPRPPLQAVLSVEYVDGDGTVVPFSDGLSPETLYWTYKAPQTPNPTPGYVEPLSGRSWPEARYESGAVRIRYRCGFGDSDDDVPEIVRQHICGLVGTFDRFRTSVHELTAGSLVQVPRGIEEFIADFGGNARRIDEPRTNRWRAIP